MAGTKTRTELELKVTADARSAVTGLKPLETSLKNVQETSEDAEKALKDLGDSHKIQVDDGEVERVKEEITRLRRQMRDDIELDINADTRDTRRKISQLRSTLKELERDDINIDVNVDQDGHLQRGVGKIRTGLGKLGVAGTAIGGGIGILGGPVGVAAGVAVGGIATGAGLAALKMLSLADQMAQAKIAFTQFLGNEPKADRFLGKLQAFAAKTPFEFPELIESSKTLLAFGVGSEDVIGLMTTLGDAAALTGGQVEDLTTIWGQMEAKGKVSNEELLQLTENGIPAYKLLADAMGKTVPEIQDMAKKGELLSDQVLPKLQDQMDKTFGGGMAKQAETLSGKWSTLKDTLAQTGTELGEALMPFAQAIIDYVQPGLENMATWAKENKGAVAIAIASGVAKAIDGLAMLVDAVATTVDSFGTIIDGIDAIGDAMGQFMIETGQLLAIVDMLPGPLGRSVPNGLGQKLAQAGGAMKDFGEGAGDALHNVADGIHGVGDGLRGSADKVRGWGEDLAKGFRGDKLTSKIDTVKSSLADLRKQPPSPEVDLKIEKAEAKLDRLEARKKEWAARQELAVVDVKVDKAKDKIEGIQDSLKYLREQPNSPKVDADIKEWTKKLRTAKGDLADLKDKKVTLTAEAHLDDAEKDINYAARDRTVTIIPNVRPVNQGGFGPQSMTAGTLMAPQAAPTAAGPTLMAAGATLMAPARYAAGGGMAGAPGAAPAPRQVERLAPRQQPIAVFLDGVEIAHRIEARRAMASTTSVRRTA